MVGAFSQHKQYSIIIRKAIHQNGEEPLPKWSAILPIILFFPLFAQIVCGHDQFFDWNHNVRFTVFAKGQFGGVLAAANNDALYAALSHFCFKNFHLRIPPIVADSRCSVYLRPCRFTMSRTASLTVQG